MNTISVEELEKIDSSKITIVDVRPADQYSRGSFPGAVNIPLDEFEERMESVDREKMVYVLCHTGDRSRDCVEKLSDAGYEAVNIEGGYRAYLRLSLSRFMENDAKDQKELKTKEIEHSIIKTFMVSTGWVNEMMLTITDKTPHTILRIPFPLDVLYTFVPPAIWKIP